MLNTSIQKSKNTVLISNMPIITYLNFAFQYSGCYGLLASRDLMVVLNETEAKTHVRGRGQDPQGRIKPYICTQRIPKGRTQIIMGSMNMEYLSDTLYRSHFIDSPFRDQEINNE